MANIAEKLKQRYLDKVSGELESATFSELDGDSIYWKPLTGAQQKAIQSMAEKSTADGICMHVKTRALDKDGELIFKDIAVIGMMNDFEFEFITKIFAAMTGLDMTAEEIEGN